MGMNFNQVPTTSAPPQQQGLPAPSMSYPGFNGGMLNSIGGDAGFQVPGTMQNAASAMSYGTGLQFEQPQRSHAAAGALSMQAPARTAAQADTQDASADAPGAATFNTSPFAFNPTSQSLGEFWSMLELPPAFLQQ